MTRTRIPAAGKLLVIRGNSGSGKTSIAQEVRRRYGRGVALIEQDYLRRIVLREHDSCATGGVAAGLIDTAARYSLDHGYHVVVEGILHSRRYAPMLRDIIDHHAGDSYVYYLDVGLAETIRRHQSRPQATQFTAQDMTAWYTPRDVLDIAGEHVIAQTSTFAQSVATILSTSGLCDAPAVTPCPAHCARCQEKLQR